MGLGPNKVLSVPDAIGIAIEEWHRDRVTGVQQELMPPTPATPTQAPGASELTTSMTHQVPAAMRPQGNAAAEAELAFGLTSVERGVHRDVPGLRESDGVCGGVCEVPRVRV